MASQGRPQGMQSLRIGGQFDVDLYNTNGG